ncbi:MAG: ABC transporter substrate-binding protein [Candidatus Rokubacteria bacterium]|nr:ABC transporter substrate-binding protein [Candidatus Rokubacteria bacterium]
MRIPRLVPILLLAGVVASPVPPAAAQGVPGVTADEIKIGAIGALTGPGYLYGRLIMNGAEVVYNEVNKAGGVHGRKISLVREDDRCDAASAIAAAKKLIFQHQVFMLHGGGCSNASIAARPEIEKANVPWVVFASVADEVTLPTAPYIFSTALAASIESAAQLEFALQQGAKRVAVISMRDAWGRARYNPLMETFKRKGVTPVADEEMSPDANDATPQVLRLRQANPDAVIIVLYPKAAAVYMRDAAKLGFKPIQVGQTAVGDLIAFREQVAIPNALERFYTISHVRFTPDDPEMERWRGLLEKHFPGDRLSVYNIMGIASATVVVEVLKRAGRDLTRDRVRDELNKLKDFSTGIYPGVISCTPADHQCHKTPAWMQLAGDKVKTIGVTPVSR